MYRPEFLGKECTAAEQKARALGLFELAVALQNTARFLSEEIYTGGKLHRAYLVPRGVRLAVCEQMNQFVECTEGRS